MEVALGELAGVEKINLANANAIAKLIFSREQLRISNKLKQQTLVTKVLSMQIWIPLKIASAPHWSYQLPTCLSSKLSSSVLNSCIPFVTLTFLTIAQSLTANKPACTTTTPTANPYHKIKRIEISIKYALWTLIILIF